MFTRSDPVPDHSNRLAVALSLLLHPYIVYIMPAVIMLGTDGLAWSLLVVVCVVLPIAITVLWQKRRDQHVYQRHSRTALYIVGWAGVLACLLASIGLNAPRPFIAAVASIALWGPLQFIVNTFVTKASVHAALVAIAITGLFLLGLITTWAGVVLAVGVIIAAGWARMVTRNHTLIQVTLGTLLGALATLIVFAVMFG